MKSNFELMAQQRLQLAGHEIAKLGGKIHRQRGVIADLKKLVRQKRLLYEDARAACLDDVDIISGLELRIERLKKTNETLVHQLSPQAIQDHLRILQQNTGLQTQVKELLASNEKLIEMLRREQSEIVKRDYLLEVLK